MPAVHERIKQFNSNRIPAYTALKYQAMAADPFYFFRGTAHLFYEDLAGANTIPGYPLTWTCGDLHLENFGSYKGDNRLVYFDINDFDEAMLAPATWELTRMVTSIFIALATMRITGKDAEAIAWLFLKHYSLTLSKGKSRYIEPQTATGIVKTFLDKVCERRQKDLVNERTVKKNGSLALRVDDKRLFKIDKPLKAALSVYVESWLTSQENIHHPYRITDAGFRIAGTGSIGIKRYLFLAERTNVEGKYLLIDMKQSLPSALQPYLQIQQPAWQNEAERVVAIQERMQNISPALLGTAVFNNEPFVVKEMQPTADKINFATLQRRYNDMEDVIQNMALLTASAQLRSSGRQGAAVADELMAFGHDHTWMQPIVTYAATYAQQVQKDYNDYLAAFRNGYFSYH